jgi:hypothetical protein
LDSQTGFGSGTASDQGATELELQRIRSETEITPDREARRETQQETEFGIETNIGTEIERGRQVPPSETEIPDEEGDDKEDEETPAFDLLGSDEQFDSGILSGQEALSSAFDDR